ncbi:hypothetical protein JL720_11323 [Aureococcus anophagefferens]|nr:hypothetical protein JL720_11323 [Aureococcus anophagefferens]
MDAEFQNLVLMAPGHTRNTRAPRRTSRTSPLRTLTTLAFAFAALPGASALAPPPTLAQADAFHVHYGAGKLGLGLVVPAVAAAGTPLAVVQRPSEKWAALEGPFDLRVNGDAVAVASPASRARRVPAGGVVRPRRRPGAPRALAGRATSFSCSLGGAMADEMAAALGSLPVRDDPPVLYCAENDHDAVAALRETLAGRARVVDCVVDRVCTAPTAEHAAFLSKRKASLVNGMHTVLSFLTLQEVGPDGDATLLKYSDMRRSNQRLVEAWRTVRVAELLEEFGADRVNAWGPGPGPPVQAWCALLDFADEVLVERFSKVDDRVKRVLGGGVEDRFETRLMPAGDWVLKHGAAHREFFLFAAGDRCWRARPAFVFAESDRIEPPRVSPRMALRRARLACRWWADKTNGDEPAPAYSR